MREGARARGGGRGRAPSVLGGSAKLPSATRFGRKPTVPTISANSRPTTVATTATLIDCSVPLIDCSVPLISPVRSVEKSGGKYSVNVSQICRTSVTAVIGLILVPDGPATPEVTVRETTGEG